MKKSFLYTLAGMVAVNLFACDVSHGPYLKTKIEMKKLKEDCTGASQQFNMNSNIVGERYVFQECLHAGADKKDVLIERKGDTVIISFQKNGNGQVLYELTVDINTQPRYNWLTIGNQTIPIIPAAN